MLKYARCLTLGLAGALAVIGHGQALPARPVKEDWSSIVRKTKLKTLPPLVAETNDRQTFTREFIALQWRPGDPVYIYLIKPKTKPKPRTCLYLYSFPESSKRFLDDNFCARLVSNGVAAVGFESALTADRYRNRPMKEWFVSELQESLASSTHDVQYILDYLQTRPDLDRQQFGMFGTGSGGSIAVLAAAADPRIKAVDLLNPWGAWPQWLASAGQVPKEERAAYLKPNFLKNVKALDPVSWLPKLKGCRVRMQFVESDPNVPRTSLAKFVKAAPKGAVIKTYPDNPDLYAAVSGGRLFDWMATALGSSPSHATYD